MLHPMDATGSRTNRSGSGQEITSGIFWIWKIELVSPL